MATAWGEVCRQCVSTVAEVPIQILLVTIAATLLGLFVLVSPIHFLSSPSHCVPERARSAAQYRPHSRHARARPDQTQSQSYQKLQIANQAIPIY
jgi:hypothetical protein